MFLTPFLPCSTNGARLCWDQYDFFIVMAQTIQTDEVAMLYTSSSSLSHVWGIAQKEHRWQKSGHVCIHTHTHTYIYCCSVAKLCLTLCDSMDCSMPGFPCPLLSPGVCSDSWYLNVYWLYLSIYMYVFSYIYFIYKKNSTSPCKIKYKAWYILFVLIFTSRYSPAYESEEIHSSIIENCLPTLGKHSVESRQLLGWILTALAQLCRPVIQPHVLLIQITMHMHRHMSPPCGPP